MVAEKTERNKAKVVTKRGTRRSNGISCYMETNKLLREIHDEQSAVGGHFLDGWVTRGKWKAVSSLSASSGCFGETGEL